ncbi:FAD-binding protein [Candidimonas nitroreducens]|uniref:Succinate dehydrogenase n=1 Tax=Candidimonas nitroreducens TaxID=683354 RepID=A0A225M030_9BURK|nr:FAD-binding protein [Candidimonas nitroreducens]OWT54757.1 hypothetical protein CEY11_21595 [Candidimonas nitroreducens]
MEVIECSADVIVVGGGGAASRAALSARQQGAEVRLLTKTAFQQGGSTVHGASEIMSMGAAGFGVADDSPRKHFEDTMRAGRGFIDESLVSVLAEEAPHRIRDLMALGVPFDRERAGPKLIQSDFGSYARALGVRGKTGKAFVQALSQAMLQAGVCVDEHIALVDLIRDAEGAIAGVLGYHAKARKLVQYRAPSVILGTGGLHGAFELQVSTAEMTGDGQAICYRHGAELVNMEFHQLGPALIHPYVQLFSGSSFRLQPKLMNGSGREFLRDYLPPEATLDAVYEAKSFPFTTANISRFIDISMAREVAEGRGSPHGGVYFSFAHVNADALARVLPNTISWLSARGIDIAADPLEVGVVFQCMNGGVRMIDPDGQSTVPGLFVIGELAGGVRGPDRPGGNSLAEGQVFGHRSGVAAARRALAGSGKYRPSPATLDSTLGELSQLASHPKASAQLAVMASEVRRAMQQHCLVEKTGEGLCTALATMRAVQDHIAAGMGVGPDTLMDVLSVRNMAQASELVLRACLNREETRGAHYRLDHLDTDPGLAHSYTLRRGEAGPTITRLDY